MSRRRHSDYLRIITGLCSQPELANWQPNLVLSGEHYIAPTIRRILDFERAEYGAFATVFPAVHIGNCFFHFAEALRRRARPYKLLIARNDAARSFYQR